MRILMVSNLYPPHSLGGYERECARAAARWASRHDVVVLTRSTGTPSVEERDGVRVLRLLPPWPEERRHGGRVLDARWRTAGALTARRALRDARPDLVVAFGTHGIATAALARLFALPSVAVVMDYSLLERLSTPGPARPRGVARRAYAAALATATAWTGAWATAVRPRRWVFASRAIRDAYEGTLGPLPACVVPSGVTVPDAPEPPPPPAPRLQVGGVGRLVPEKGWHTLVASARLLALRDGDSAPDVEIRGPVVDPAYAARLREAAAAAVADGARVRIGEPIAEQDVRAWMARKECIAVPSEWAEPQGIVSLEAMATGRAVVGTRCGGLAEALEDGVTALVHEPGDAAGLADALRRLAADRPLRERLALTGYALVRDRFREEVAAAALDQVVLGDVHA